MSLAFKGRHFAPDVILLCMRWYCRYALSYRDLEEMMAERHLSVDHTTIYRWVQHYAPELDRRVQWCKPLQTKTWYVDETYVKVRGEWMYLYRAIGDGGETLDFYLSQTRATKAAKQFLSKALNRSPHNRPSVRSCPSTWWKSGVTESAPFQAAAVGSRTVSGLVLAAMSSAMGSVCM